MLTANKLQAIRNFTGPAFESTVSPWKPRPCRRADHAWPPSAHPIHSQPLATPRPAGARAATPSQVIDPLYLFACKLEWEQRQETSAAWELLAAAQSSDGDTRAHARSLLAGSQDLGGSALSVCGDPAEAPLQQHNSTEAAVKTPYGLDIIDSCIACSLRRPGFFCGLSSTGLHALDQASHKSNLPAGAILFVEGQAPRGMFTICSGRVNLSTTSREGKILILKTAEAGEALGLSAAISGDGYEVTAEAATHCQLNFVDRKRLLELMLAHSEMSVRAAQSLSRDFQSAYRDIHDLVLTRSSSGKLARLLLSNSSARDTSAAEARVRCNMTHEEMAQRIGASRETVTRLLSDLKKKRLIRMEGPTLVIPDRVALEALAV